MSVIPVNQNCITNVQPILEVSKNQRLSSPLIRGETLSATVIEKLPANQYLIYLKNVTLSASSVIPFYKGEKLQVNVLSVQPQIILTIVDAAEQKIASKINDGLLKWRMNPDSLVELLNKVKDFSANLKSSDLLSALPKKEIDHLLDLLNKIIFSSQTKKNPLFVKEFVSKIGLMLETDLGRIAKGLNVDKNFPSILENLKASLLKINAAITDAQKEKASLDSTTVAKLTDLASFASDILQAIESRQMVNIVYQRNESGLYLQIPMLLGGTLRQADIFITPENKKEMSMKKYSSAFILLFLNLDYLGNIAIDTSVRQGSIRCVIKCERKDTKEIVADAQDELKKGLSLVGYRVEKLECIMVPNLQQQKMEYMEQQILGSVEMVDYFI